MRVLLIDDDQDTQRIFRLIMDHYGHDLHIAKNAFEGLDHLKSHQPDVIIIDILLPGLDGYQTLNRIKTENLAPDARFLATTAYYSDDTDIAVMERGFHGFLSKPLNSATLVRSLENT